MLCLNKEQEKAVLYNDGPLLILAGAGTGKTRVLTEKIVYLINSYLAEPNQILAVTFTNKAANQMKNRIKNDIGHNINNVWVGTFHSIATKILKRHCEDINIKSNFNIIDPADQLHILKQVVLKLNLDIKFYSPKSYLYHIERAKDEGNDAHKRWDYIPKFLEIYQNYQKRLKELNAVDFGDLLSYNLEIFKNQETLSYYQNKFRYILVDEYQDTNNIQYMWLKKLFTKNICVVGDDDQSIYSWRGAKIENILKFEKDFKNTRVIKLEHNYRSTNNILQVASKLIKNNNNRHCKTLWSEIKDGKKPQIISCSTDKEEATRIASIIKTIISSNKTIAVLVRAGYQTRIFEEHFASYSINYKLIGAVKFYQRKEIKDAISYLKLVNNLHDDLALERIINIPKRGVGDKNLISLKKIAEEKNISLFSAAKYTVTNHLVKGKLKENLEEFCSNIERYNLQLNNNEVNLSKLTSEIIEDLGYFNLYKKDDNPETIVRYENLKEFINSLNDFKNINSFLDHITLVNSSETEEEKNTVNIMTIHSAKGLEFDAVFIPGLEEGIFPNSKSLKMNESLEEERRLFYVAITRAKYELYISFARIRYRYNSLQSSKVSQFVTEIPIENIETNFNFNILKSKSANSYSNKLLSADKKVSHKIFGHGIVVQEIDNKLTVIFKDGKTRNILKNFLTIIT